MAAMIHRLWDSKMDFYFYFCSCFFIATWKGGFLCSHRVIQRGRCEPQPQSSLRVTLWEQNELAVLVQVITDLINLRVATGEAEKIDSIIYRILSELRHNFKAASYAFENEYRVIIYCEPDATITKEINGKSVKENIVKIDMQGGLPRSFYIESENKIGPYIRRIYIGPKVPNPERWMYLEVVAKQKGLTRLKVQASTQKFQ